jgi:hypothetical protein
LEQLVENLKVFNRRERFFVVGWALDNSAFKLGDTFRKQLAADTGFDVPGDAFCAMDFPLDWIIGCLWLTKGEQASYSMLETGDVNKSNDDVDLLIAYQEQGKTHLLMIEAKGVTGWKNKQLRNKAKRLAQIFGSGEIPDDWPTVEPHFVLASPKKSSLIDVSEWPGWMKHDGQPRWWLELALPEGLRKIVRCDENGKKNAEGNFWKIV